MEYLVKHPNGMHLLHGFLVTVLKRTGKKAVVRAVHSIPEPVQGWVEAAWLVPTRRGFRTLETFRRFAQKHGLRVRQVTRTKTNVYYQLWDKAGVIVGFFNTSSSSGSASLES